MAHALLGYEGACRNIHGHSYELHVSVTSGTDGNEYIPAPGIMIDFKELKRVVRATIIDAFDHRLILSKEFIKMKGPVMSMENIFPFDAEPSAENMLVFIRRTLENVLPGGIRLAALKLYETKESYAEWINKNI